MSYHKNNNSNRNVSEIINILSNNDIKQIIINFLYSNLKPFSNFQNHELKNKQDLQNINNLDYIVSYNYNGQASYLLFLRNKDRYYSCVINKKHLTTDLKNLIIDDIHLIPFDISLELKIYDGTILDGIYYSNKESKQLMFYVNDVLKFRGENKIKDNIRNKFIELSAYLKHFNQNKIFISINDKIVNISDFYNNVTKDKNIKGLNFYPLNSGVSYTFNFYCKQKPETKHQIKTGTKSMKQIKSINEYFIDTKKRLKLKDDYLKSKQEIIFNFTVKPQLKNNELFDIYVNDIFVDNLFLNLTTHKKLVDQLEHKQNIIKTKYDKNRKQWVYIGIGEKETDMDEIKLYFNVDVEKL